MPPLADDTSTRWFPIVNATLIALNLAVFGLMVTKACVRRLSHQGEDTGWGAA